MEDCDFFREATLRICGSLEIDKALSECLLFIRQAIPADQISLHVYDRHQGILETLALADLSGGKTLSLLTHYPPEVRAVIERRGKGVVRIFRHIGDDEVSRPLATKLNVLDSSGMRTKLALEGKDLGMIFVTNEAGEEYTEEHGRLLTMLNEPFAIALSNCLMYRELRRINDLLDDDNRYLQGELRQIAGDEIIGADFGLKGVMDMVRQVAPLDSPVLLLGETGAGKEVIAGAVHNLSRRKDGPLIKVNCGAIPETLMDSELFGHEKGAFTGAISRKRGRFERADQGTIFLDEIGELSLEAQVRFLRVLQEKEIERVGGSEPVKVDIRIVAATHRNLEEMLAKEQFREDLYFRLKVFPIVIPPLRERSEDIPKLVQHVIQKKAQEMKLSEVPTLVPGALERLMAYPWPGNVREMQNAVERALILSRTGIPFAFDDLQAPAQGDTAEPLALAAQQSLKLDLAMARHIQKALDLAGGKVEGKGGAAELLDVNPRTLRNRMAKLGIAFGRKAKGK